VCAIVASASVFLLAAELLKRFGAYQRDSISMAEALIVALSLAIAFQPLKTRVHTYLNRYLYRETYDYERTLREATHRLSTLLELDPLLNYLMSVIETTVRAEHASVYLWNPSEKAFQITSSIGGTRTSHTQAISSPIHADSPLARFFLAHRQTLAREEVIRDAPDPLREAASVDLHNVGGDIAFPLLDGQTLLGAVVVGPKRSGDPFFSDDITLLETLVSQATIALANAQLYRQVLTANQYVDNILSTMDSGVIALNSSAKVTLFNAAAERLTRLRAGSLLNSSYQSLPSCLALPLRDTLELRIARTQFETLIQHSDGTFVPIVCSTAVLRREDGTIDGALVVFSDLTRLKGLEREKRRAERLSSFGALASGVAHEIKNPLVAIRTFAELLPERYTDVDFREDFSKVVITEIARIDDLVGRLRGLAAPASAPVGAIDIREPIDDTLLLLRAQLEQTRTVVRCDFQDSAPLVSVHHSQLKQLFLNLFLNAIEAMGVEGVLSVAVSRRTMNGAEIVKVEVSDTGPGIPEALRAAVFEPFFTTKSKGSGLGLAICRGIVDTHRGSIQAECKPNTRGTTIVIELPAGSVAHALASEQTMHG
jgi:nitrogen-specific signal transduction histidine kinase